MSVKDILAPFAVWKRVLEKPYTTAKPLTDRPGAPRYRGFHTNQIDQCIGCGTCEEVCQNNAIDLVPVEGRTSKHGDSGLRPQIDYGRCCWCGLCVDICPTGSLGMSNEYVWVDEDAEAYRFVPGAEEKPWDKSELGYKRHDGYKLLDPVRVEMPMMPPEESEKSFFEMVKGYSKEQAKKEADRCLGCGICVASCPAHMNIPAYIEAIREDNVEDGLRITYESNPLPASCGRVCSHACEYSCAMNKSGEAVSIRWLKRYIADQIYLKDYDKVLNRPDELNGRHIAVIGAGPGGLAAAYYLRMMGYSVTMYDGNDAAGGMLRYGIPEYRLPYDQLDKDIEYIRSLGVRFNQDVMVGRDLQFEKLYSDYDAVFFSTGLPKPYSMNVEGENHPRVLSGLKVLDDVTKGINPGTGKKIAVIGGGNVAMDAARTTRRFGSDVAIYYRRREEDMPADPEEIHEAKAEHVDLITQAIPVAVEDAPNGQVTLVWGKAKMVDKGGRRPEPVLIEDEIHRVTVDSIISAIGQDADYSFLPESFLERVKIERGKVVIDRFGRTGDAKVFAGGDIANSKRDAISAIANGHEAAKGIDWMLNPDEPTTPRISP